MSKKNNYLGKLPVLSGVDPEDIKRMPPLLQKFLYLSLEPENWEKPVKAICKKAGFNWGSVKTLIWEYGTEDFWRLRARLIKGVMAQELPKIYNALIKRAAKGNTQAIKLALQWTGELVDRQEVEQKGDIVVKIVREKPK